MKHLIEPGQVREVRILDVPRLGAVAGYFDNQEALEREVKKYDGRGNIYITLNPVKPALLARANNRLVERAKSATTDNDIVCREWFYIDIDPVRPSGIMASNLEKEAAHKTTKKVFNFLKDMGWPHPEVNDSGNGLHLLYKIDLPNDDKSRDLIKNCVLALAHRFNDEKVSIDTSVFNAARIIRLVGSLNCKGDGTPDRPHRRSAVLKTSAELITVSREQLQALAAFAPQPQTEPARMMENGFDLENWIHEHSLPVAFSGPWQGGKKWVLNPCPWEAAHTNRSAYIIQFSNGAIAAGCHHNSCQGRDWHSLRDLYEPGWQDKQRPLQQAAGKQPAKPVVKREIDLAKILTTPDLDKEAKPTEWVIPGMVSRGDLTLTVGPQKGGKSWLWLRGACEISIGGRFMDGFARVEQQKVLYLMYDNVGEVRINNRIRKAGWKLDPDYLRFVFVENVRQQGATMDLDQPDSFFNTIISSWNPALVIIDTLGSAHSKNENKNDEMKPIMDKLTGLARDMNIAIVVLHHSRKRRVAEYGTQMQMDDSIGASIMLRLASNIIGIEKRVNEAGGNIHIVKSLGSWFKEFQPFEFQLIDETDTNSRVWVRMPINLSAGVDEDAKEQILKIIKFQYSKGESFTRQEIVKRTGLTAPTASGVLNNLVTTGLLRSEGSTKNKIFIIPGGDEDIWI